MAGRDRHDDDFEDRPRKRSGLVGVLIGMFWGVVFFGAGLVVLSEFGPPPGRIAPVADGRAASDPPSDAGVVSKPGTGTLSPAKAGPEAETDATTTPEKPATAEALPAATDAPAPDADTGGTVAAAPDAAPVPGPDAAPTTDGVGEPGPERRATGLLPIARDKVAISEPEKASEPESGDDTPTDSAPAPEIQLSGPAFEVNARPFIGPRNAGLLSVVLYGGGGDPLPTEALAEISMPLTLAINADEPDQVGVARDAATRGHEVLAFLPLAITGGAGGLTARDPTDRLEIEAARTLATLNMAVGAAAPDGTRILDNPEAMTALLKPVARHSFLWVEPRPSTRSAAARLAATENLVFLQANVFVAPGSTLEQVLSGIEEAAAQARARGTAIIFIEASGDSLRAVLQWGIEKGGGDVRLAPISAIARKRGQG